MNRYFQVNVIQEKSSLLIITLTVIVDKNSVTESSLDNASLKGSQISQQEILNFLPNSTIPSVKFHLNLILESSRNANSSIVQCLTVISHQNEVSFTNLFQFF